MSTPRNTELAIILKNDPTRLRIRCVESEKRKIRKNRSRRKAEERREHI